MNAKIDIDEYYKIYIATEKSTHYINKLLSEKNKNDAIQNNNIIKNNDIIQDNNIIAKNIVIKEIKKTKCKETQPEPDHE